MFCPHCGTEVPEEGTFCPKCGADVRNIQGHSAQVPEHTGSGYYGGPETGRRQYYQPDNRQSQGPAYQPRQWNREQANQQQLSMYWY